MGGLQVFKSYGAEFIGVKMDDEGILTDNLEERLQWLKKQDEHYKFLYLVPGFPESERGDPERSGEGGR